MPVTDQLARPLRDLRVSVTDRCNFRCTYCMPGEVFGPDPAFLERSEPLTFEEIARLTAVFARLGVRKVRLTGGEPLVRRDLERLVAMVAGVDGIEDIALTTNGSLLAPKAEALRDAGLRRVTVSLDALDPDVFRAFADTPMPVERVLEGLAAARDAGFDPVKVNCVVKRGVNEGEIVPLAAFGREHGYVVRFIEFMDVGATNGWRLDDVVPAAEIVRGLSKLGGRIARRGLQRLFYVDQWFLAYRFGSEEHWQGDARRFTRLMPPKDRYWADPFPIERGDRHAQRAVGEQAMLVHRPGGHGLRDHHARDPRRPQRPGGARREPGRAGRRPGTRIGPPSRCATHGPSARSGTVPRFSPSRPTPALRPRTPPTAPRAVGAPDRGDSSPWGRR